MALGESGVSIHPFAEGRRVAGRLGAGGGSNVSPRSAQGEQYQTAGTVLCVDPDDEARGATATALRDATGREVVTCPDSAGAREALTATIDCVVTAFELSDGTGPDLLAAVRETAPDVGVVLFTDADVDDIGTGGLDDGIVEYVPKGAPNAYARLADLVGHTVRLRTRTAYPLPADESERVGALEPIPTGRNASTATGETDGTGWGRVPPETGGLKPDRVARSHMADDTDSDDGTVRTWLVERSYDSRNLITLVYATPDGMRAQTRELSSTMLDRTPVTAARDVDPDDLAPVDPDDRERYRTEAARVRENNAPDDEI